MTQTEALREAAIEAQRRQARLSAEVGTLNPNALKAARQAQREATSRAIREYAEAAGIDPIDAAVEIVAEA